MRGGEPDVRFDPTTNTFVPLPGGDTLDGGLGDDVYQAQANDTIVDAGGNDTIIGGKGDTLHADFGPLGGIAVQFV